MKKIILILFLTTLITLSGCALGQFIEKIDGNIGKILTPHPTSITYRPGATTQELDK